MSGYYHSYLVLQNLDDGGGYTLTGLPVAGDIAVFVRDGRGQSWRVGEDDEVSPMLVLVDSGDDRYFMAGATLGVGMLSRVCTDRLAAPALSNDLWNNSLSAREMWAEAWAQARTEAEHWAGLLDEQDEDEVEAYDE